MLWARFNGGAHSSRLQPLGLSMSALAINNASVFYPIPGKPPVHALKNIQLEIHEKDLLVHRAAASRLCSI
jgi:hypothetical protein